MFEKSETVGVIDARAKITLSNKVCHSKITFCVLNIATKSTVRMRALLHFQFVAEAYVFSSITHYS